MKKVLTIIAIAASFFAATPSQAQVSFGVKGGLNITDMSLSSDVLSESNRTGFFIGPTVKFTLPIVGLGFDASALYDQREAKLEGNTFKQKSINIPINLRYTIGLGDMAGIYVAAGPQFGINVGDSEFKWNSTSSYELKKSNFSINVGAGVMLLSSLEIGATYNIACGKTGEVTVGNALDVIKTNNNAWQINAAYYV